MDTFTRHTGHHPSETAAPEAAFAPPATPDRVRTCGHCQYDGPLQAYDIYPLFLRGSMIAVGFALGILPGLLLLSWRRHTPPLRAVTCPLCLFRRLEPASEPIR